MFSSVFFPVGWGPGLQVSVLLHNAASDISWPWCPKIGLFLKALVV